MRGKVLIIGLVLFACHAEEVIAFDERLPGVGGFLGINTGGTSSFGGVSSSTGGSILPGGGQTSAGGAAGGGDAGLANSAGVAGQAALLCNSARPRGNGNTPLIDNFDDADLILPNLDQRSGSTVFDGDGSDGATHLLTTADGSLRVQGSGFGLNGGFGARVALVLNQQDVACAYDASQYAGVSFSASGEVSQTLWLMIGTAGVIPVELGGTCTPEPECLNKHYTELSIGPEPRIYNVSWDMLAQKDFGVIVDFDPTEIVTIEFVFPQLVENGPALEFDVTIDDVAFVQR